MREVNPQPVRGLILQDLNEHEITLTYSSLVFSTRAINKEVHIGNVSHNALITIITSFDTLLLLSHFYTNCSNDAPNVLTQTRLARGVGDDGEVACGSRGMTALT